MKLEELVEDKVILDAVMIEMANLFSNVTGVPYAIWFGEVWGQHGPRIKVSNVKGRFAQNDNFVISVSRTPSVLTKTSMRIQITELEDIFDWVKINYNTLMKMWAMYETGGGDLVPLLQQLKKDLNEV